MAATLMVDRAILHYYHHQAHGRNTAISPDRAASLFRIPQMLLAAFGFLYDLFIFDWSLTPRGHAGLRRSAADDARFADYCRSLFSHVKFPAYWRNYWLSLYDFWDFGATITIKDGFMAAAIYIQGAAQEALMIWAAHSMGRVIAGHFNAAPIISFRGTRPLMAYAWCAASPICL